MICLQFWYRLLVAWAVCRGLLFPFSGSYAQTSGYQRPPVIDNLKEYRHWAAGDSMRQLVELRSLIPSVIYDLRYASVNNFVAKPLYPTGTDRCYLLRSAAIKLAGVARALQPMGIGLKIFDGYRPYSVTEQFWRLVQDERYVANPAKGSGHNRGAAVDLTLIDLRTGEELDMGTGFDNFSDTAHHGFLPLSPAVLQHRSLLKKLMISEGFMALDTEWWHYALPDAGRYPLLDLSFKKIPVRIKR